MLGRFWCGIFVMAVPSLWGQVSSSAPQASATVSESNSSNTSVTDQDVSMLTPPTVNAGSYPVVGLAEERSNYLRLGIIFTTAYSDNILGGSTSAPVSDVSYSIWPTISLDQTTPRLHSVFTYSPGFTFYQKTTSRNETDQNVSGKVEYRLSPHVTVTVQDTFLKTSNIFNQPNLVNEPISGGGLPPSVAVIAPVADQLRNIASGGISYQFGPNSMVGANGSFTYLNYPDPNQVPGLFNSRSETGSGFYNHRLSKKHYVGAMYQYSRMLALPEGSETGSQTTTQTQTIYGFYTVYFKPTISLSLSGGPQYYNAVQSPLPASNAWRPAATASFGWQAQRTNVAISYSHVVSGAGGLLGAYDSDNATGSVHWQVARYWDIGASGFYSNYKALTPLFVSSTPGGHTLSGTASVKYTFRGYLSFEGGYTRLHQDYGDIPLVSAFPNTNREYISIAYHFARPLGR
jgi:hypothetical protein